MKELEWPIPEFKPCVSYYEGLNMTEMILEDTTIVWKSWKGMHHTVELGYNNNGKLIGIQIWDKIDTL